MATQCRCAATLVLLAILTVPRTAFSETRLTGTVYLPGGKPAPMTQVKLFYFHDLTGYGSRWLAETKSNAQGRFTIAKPDFQPPPVLCTEPTGAGLFLTATRLDCAAAVTALSPDKVDGYNLWLDTPRRISFTATDPTGEPMRNAAVRLTPEWGTTGPLGRPLVLLTPEGRGDDVSYYGVLEAIYRTATEGDGSGEFPNGMYGPIWVRLSAKGYAVVTETPRLGDAHLFLRSYGDPTVVHGKITDAATGEPLPNALVLTSSYWWPATCAGASASTDARGEYSFQVWPASAKGAGEEIVAIDLSRQPLHVPKTAMIFQGAGAQPLIDFALPRGRSVTGKAVDLATGRPVAGAVVSVADDGGGIVQRRLTDAEGRFAFCVPGDSGSIKVERAPQGYRIVDPGPVSTYSITGEKVEVLLSPMVEKMPRRRIILVDESGRPASAVDIWAVRLDRVGVLGGMTDGNGAVDLEGIGDDYDAYLDVYAMSRDGTSACFADVPPATVLQDAPMQLMMRPVKPVETVLQIPTGNVVPGTVKMGVQVRQNTIIWLRDFPVPNEAGEMLARVPCLSQVSYCVAGLFSGRPNFDEEVNAFWFDEAVKAPREVITSSMPVSIPPNSTVAQNFKTDLERLKDAPWKKEDPVQKNLTWYALKAGLAIADSERQELKRITEILGETNFVVSAIAFGKDTVWVGTSKGLFAWERKEMYWTRFAIGGLFLDAPVTQLSLDEAGKLRVTVAQDAKPRTFEYDVATGNWHEAP